MEHYYKSEDIVKEIEDWWNSWCKKQDSDFPDINKLLEVFAQELKTAMAKTINLYSSVNSDTCGHEVGDCSVTSNNPCKETYTPLVGQGRLYSNSLEETNE